MQPAEILDDVAELALKGAATGGLDGTEEDLIVRVEVPPRRRRQIQGRAGADVLLFPRGALEVGEEAGGILEA